MTQVSAFAGGATDAGADWNTPTNITGTNDGTNTTWSSTTRNGTSSTLTANTFGTFSAIPGGSTINFVDVTIWHYETGTPIDFLQATLLANATSKGATNLTINGTAGNSQTIRFTNVTLAELQAGTMNLTFVGDRGNGTTASAMNLDAALITVDYTGGAAPQTVPIAQASEADTAQAATAVLTPPPQTVAIAQATEADTAQAAVVQQAGGPQTVPAAPATETDTAGELGRDKAYPLTQAW
jgi:hypothetical protein